MWIILSYDINAKRNAKALKICRKYLTHVQKSLFEGSISDKNYQRLKNSLAKVIVPDEDQIVVYVFDSMRYASKEMIGIHTTQDNII